MRVGKFALIVPVMTSTEGRCVAVMTWMPAARAICARRCTAPSMSLPATIIRSAISSIMTMMKGIGSSSKLFRLEDRLAGLVVEAGLHGARQCSAIMSVAWVEMPDAEDTADLQQLVDRPGTGNVTELSTKDGPHQDVGYRGWYYRSGRDDTTFHSVQAEPLADDEGSRDLARRAAGATAVD